jgi:hypothetical protein
MAAVVSHRVWFDIVHRPPGAEFDERGEFTVKPPTLALGWGAGAKLRLPLASPLW